MATATSKPEPWATQHNARVLTLAASFLIAPAILITGVTALAAVHTVTHHPANSQVQTIEEDSPGWNCHTMGNHICG